MNNQFNRLIPELLVTDVEKSLSFYVGILGFKHECGCDTPPSALLSYDSGQIGLQQLTPEARETGFFVQPFGRGLSVLVATHELFHLRERLRDADYPMLGEIEERAYTVGPIMYQTFELQVRDPDGYLLRFINPAE